MAVELQAYADSASIVARGQVYHSHMPYMRSRRHSIILACGVAALLGCGSKDGGNSKSGERPAQHVARACKDVDPARMSDASAAEPRDGFTSLAERDSLLKLIEAGEQKWRAGRPAGYLITVVPLCFCRDRGQPIVIRVAADSVIASRDTTGQQSWPDDWRAGLHVAGLFKEARQFTCDSTRTTRLTLDPTLGYPTVLSTVSRLDMSDLDREYRVLSLAPELGDR
jgi:hypothetical protein